MPTLTKTTNASKMFMALDLKGLCVWGGTFRV
jgi:hypothetical protein